MFLLPGILVSLITIWVFFLLGISGVDDAGTCLVVVTDYDFVNKFNLSKMYYLIIISGLYDFIYF